MVLAEIALLESAATMREIRGSGDRRALLQGTGISESFPVDTKIGSMTS